jgi:hypothetical protein
MAKLNGIMGGLLTSEVDFGVVEEELENGTIALNKVPIETIISSSLL